MGEKYAEEDLVANRTDRFLPLLARLRTYRQHLAVSIPAKGEGRPPAEHYGPGELKSRVGISEYEPSGESADETRARYLSYNIARMASKSDEVQCFRRRVLGSGDTTLSESEAIAFLKTPAAWLLTEHEVQNLGVPLTGHEAECVQEQWGLDDADSLWEQFHITLKWPGGQWVSQRRIWPIRDGVDLKIDSSDIDTESTRVMRGSYLYDLARTARLIADRFSWTESSAAWFILTGMFSIIPALKMTSSINYAIGGMESATINLQVQPFVSPTTVAKAYRRLQNDLIGHRVGPHIIHKKLAMMNFVCERWGQSEKLPEWPLRMAEWNALVEGEWNLPKWKYRNPDHMHRDFQETCRRVLLPRYIAVIPGTRRRIRKPKPLPRFFTYTLKEGATETACGCFMCERFAPCKCYLLVDNHERGPQGIMVCSGCHQDRPRFSVSPSQVHVYPATAIVEYFPLANKRKRKKPR